MLNREVGPINSFLTIPGIALSIRPHFKIKHYYNNLRPWETSRASSNIHLK